jgi:hypothetical protein
LHAEALVPALPTGSTTVVRCKRSATAKLVFHTRMSFTAIDR